MRSERSGRALRRSAATPAIAAGLAVMVASGLAVAVALAVAPPASATSPTTAAPAPAKAEALPPVKSVAGEGPAVLRVRVDGPEDIRGLADRDLLEFHDRAAGYVLVLEEDAASALDELRARGYDASIDPARTEDVRRAAAVAQRSIPGYGCYRTVEETYAAAEGLVAAHPDLASWTDIGDSWEKQQGLGGHDLRVLKLTRSSVPGPKPKLVATCAIHAREYTTAELCTRFAEMLVDGYGEDADATWLLDHHEIHLVLHTNPDGRKQAEAGSLWRKNTNQDYCGATSSSRGADLNRNFAFEWGCCGGSSGSACSETYRGPAPASEPEVQAVQAYLVSQFPDQRDAPLDAPAPDDATGVYLDIHSYSELVLWPWGFGGSSPNMPALQTLGRKLAFFNGYTPQQAIDLYATDGTTIDFAYGELGVASFVFELGTAFFESCSTFESAILPDNLDALRYAAKVARTPYLTAAGPDALDIAVAPLLGAPDEARTVTATLDDGRFEQGNGAEPVQTVVGAELFLDTPPWSPGSSAIPMAAADGAFDTAVEAAVATVDTIGLAAGRHVLFVRALDSDGNAGAVSARFFWVDDGTGGSLAGFVTEAGTSAPLAATVSVASLGAAVATDPATGAYALALPAGSWTVTVEAPGHVAAVLEDVAVGGGAVVPLDIQLAAYPPILVVDDDDNDPDVGASVAAVLDGLGEGYFVWDTANSDDEPPSELLASFDAVIWSTGEEYGGFAGPGPEGEAALAAWLDGGGCLLVAAQDYYYDRGLTSFMQTYLGVSSAVSDVGQTTVTGQGSVFDGLGPYSLSFPYSNWTDTVTPGATAEIAFGGTSGSAAVARDGGHYRTSFWGFGVETLPSAADREAAVGRFLGWCDALAEADGDQDGWSNGSDCAPGDGAVWSMPTSATGLTVGRGAVDDLAWVAPLAPGAAAVSYDVLRADAPDGFAAAACVAADAASTVATDGSLPGPGELFAYLVRVRNACGATLGEASPGVDPRAGASCP